MKKIIISIVCLVLMSSCGNYDYNISELPHVKIKFSELPEEVQNFFNDPSDFRHITDDGYEFGFLDLIYLDKATDYKFETKSTFVESWIAYYKIIDLKNGVSYRVDYGNPSPFVVFNNKLYLQNEFNVLDSAKEFNTLEFVCYTLKEK